jgi:Tfp pilus assembly protein PilO
MSQRFGVWKRGNWLTTASLLGITVGFVLLVFMPQMKRIRELEMEVQLLEQFIAQEPALAAQLELGRREYEDTAAFVESWRRTAPPGRKTAALFGRIAHLAHEAGADVVRFEPGPVEEGDALRRLTLEIGGQGPFEDLFGWLRAMESLPETVWIEELSVERREGRQDLQCDVTLAIFADKSEKSD